jgi:hypothetical protein
VLKNLKNFERKSKKTSWSAFFTDENIAKKL